MSSGNIFEQTSFFNEVNVFGESSHTNRASPEKVRSQPTRSADGRLRTLSKLTFVVGAALGVASTFTVGTAVASSGATVRTAAEREKKPEPSARSEEITPSVGSDSTSAFVESPSAETREVSVEEHRRWADYLETLGETAPELGPEVAMRAKGLWEHFKATLGVLPPVPKAGPTPDESLQMVWDKGDHHLEVEVYSDRFEWFYKERKTKLLKGGSEKSIKKLERAVSPHIPFFV